MLAKNSSPTTAIGIKPVKSLSSDERALTVQLEQLLSVPFAGGITRFLDIDIDEDLNISGLFQAREKIVEFRVGQEKMSYKLAQDRRGKTDSWLASFTLALQKSDRMDAKPIRFRVSNSRPKNCVKGIPCGGTCISANDTCEVDLKNVASPRQIANLMQTAARVKSAEAQVGKPKPLRTEITKPESDDLEDKTIRELKLVARDYGVYRYSEMNSEQLRRTIRQAKEASKDPAQQNRLSRTFQRVNESTPRLRRAGVSNKTAPERALITSVRRWERINRIMKLSGVDPKLASAAITAVVMGISIQTFNRLKDKYRQNLPESARSAYERASKMPTEYTPRGNITFAVGGFSGEGSYARKIKDLLTAPAEQENATDADKWFRDRNHFVLMDSKEFDIPQIKSSKKNKDGTYNSMYLAELSNKAFGAYLKNFRRGRNEASVELAAKIYAYGNRRTKEGKYANKEKTFNVIAHGPGGNTAYEAMEILARMNGPKSRPGREVLAQVNLVTLGTTDFGYTEKGLVRERNITSAQDPFSFLPQRNEKWISNVKGHEASDYLRVPEVRDEVLQAFGYYSYTNYQREMTLRKKQPQAGG